MFYNFSASQHEFDLFLNSEFNILLNNNVSRVQRSTSLLATMVLYGSCSVDNSVNQPLVSQQPSREEQELDNQRTWIASTTGNSNKRCRTTSWTSSDLNMDSKCSTNRCDWTTPDGDQQVQDHQHGSKPTSQWTTWGWRYDEGSTTTSSWMRRQQDRSTMGMLTPKKNQQHWKGATPAVPTEVKQQALMVCTEFRVQQSFGRQDLQHQIVSRGRVKIQHGPMPLPTSRPWAYNCLSLQLIEPDSPTDKKCVCTTELGFSYNNIF